LQPLVRVLLLWFALDRDAVEAVLLTFRLIWLSESVDESDVCCWTGKVDG
jgi:hypothetical protein